MKKIASILLIAVVTSLVTVWAYDQMRPNIHEVVIDRNANTPVYEYVDSSPTVTGSNVDFTDAAAKSTPAVVHITATVVSTVNTPQNFLDDNFFRFFPAPPGARERKSQSTGSGVIISNNGHIVTNNHVIDNATEVEVTLWNKEKIKADIIGTDPSTDLALLKIESTDLPTLQLANSDDVLVGEWVLAVGNPFNLESTVTAGIVSAKGRNINILKDQYSIESFIQTDAAVNPGNSGGALVDLNGNLIGINTAIATPTGVYAGYAFAVPSNIVSKVCEDLRNYGVVQRGFLGVMIREVDGNVAKELDLAVNSGVYVDRLVDKGAAEKAGIERGDVIIKIDDKIINAVPELQEAIGSKRPGDMVNVLLNRDGEEKIVPVTLRNKDGETSIIEKEAVQPLSLLGIDLEDLSVTEKGKLGISEGVRVAKVNDGHLKRHTKIREGFIITRIDGIKMENKEDVDEFFTKKQKGSGMIEGFYPGIPGKIYYGYGLD